MEGKLTQRTASDIYTVSHLLCLLLLALQLGLQLLHFPICSLPPALCICARLLLLVMQLLQAWLNPYSDPMGDLFVIGAVASWTEKRGTGLGRKHLVCFTCDTHLVQLLLSKGANVNAPCGEWVSGARTYTSYTKLAL